MNILHANLPVILHGPAYSAYVRIAMLTLCEKSVPYEHKEIDIFGDTPADREARNGYLRLQPFGKVPTLVHGEFTIYETAAIARYVDEQFDGPILQPTNAQQRARMNQIIGIIDSYAYRAMVWGVYVELVSHPRQGIETDRVLVKASKATAQICLSELSTLLGASSYLAGDALTLADLYAAPIFGYFTLARLGQEMLAAQSTLRAWWQRMQMRPSVQEYVLQEHVLQEHVSDEDKSEGTQVAS